MAAGAARSLAASVNARCRIAVEYAGRGMTRIATLRSQPPLLLRPTPGAVYLVGGAAGPLGGDDVHLEVRVGSNASLTLRTVAACVALPGTHGATSCFTVDVYVGTEGSLCWLPEPSVAACGCRHQVRAVVRAEQGARVVWREALLLGRHGEVPGSYWSRMDLEVSGRPVLRQELAVGPAVPGWDASAVTGGARAIGSVLVVDPGWTENVPSPAMLGDTAAAFPLAGPAALVSALASDATSLLATLAGGLRYLEGSEPATSTIVQPRVSGARTGLSRRGERGGGRPTGVSGEEEG